MPNLIRYSKNLAKVVIFFHIHKPFRVFVEKTIDFIYFYLISEKKAVTLRDFTNKMKEVLIVIAALGIALVLLSVRVLLKKNGRFSSQHIAQNKRMKADGIHCANSQDKEARRGNKNKIKVNEL